MGNGNSRLAWSVAAVFALLFAASMSGIVQGGALDPPGAPGSTMKSLDDVPPAWNQQLPATGGCDSPRFDCVLADTAVLDRETGLVWQRDPQSSLTVWDASIEACNDLFLGGRYGWQLPTFAEFASLFDGSSTALPAGHPFTVSAGDLSTSYWTASADSDLTTGAFALLPVNPSTGNGAKTLGLRRWCVRGGNGVEGL